MSWPTVTGTRAPITVFGACGEGEPVQPALANVPNLWQPFIELKQLKVNARTLDMMRRDHGEALFQSIWDAVKLESLILYTRDFSPLETAITMLRDSLLRYHQLSRGNLRRLFLPMHQMLSRETSFPCLLAALTPLTVRELRVETTSVGMMTCPTYVRSLTGFQRDPPQTAQAHLRAPYLALGVVSMPTIRRGGCGSPSATLATDGYAMRCQ